MTQTQWLLIARFMLIVLERMMYKEPPGVPEKTTMLVLIGALRKEVDRHRP